MLRPTELLAATWIAASCFVVEQSLAFAPPATRTTIHHHATASTTSTTILWAKPGGGKKRKRRRKQPPGTTTSTNADPAAASVTPPPAAAATSDSVAAALPDDAPSEDLTDNDLASIADIANFEFKPPSDDITAGMVDDSGAEGRPAAEAIPLPDIREVKQKKQIEEELARIEEEKEKTKVKVNRNDKEAFTKLLEQMPYSDADDSLFVEEEYGTVSALLGERAEKFLGIPTGPLQVGHFVGALGIVLMAFVEYPGFPLTNLPTPLRDALQGGLGTVYAINTVLAGLSFFKAGERGQPKLLWVAKTFSVGGLAFDQLMQLPTTEEVDKAKSRKGARSLENLMKKRISPISFALRAAVADNENTSLDDLQARLYEFLSSKRIDDAIGLLDHAEQLYRSDMHSVTPDRDFFTLILQALAAQPNPDHPGKAEKVLEHMNRVARDVDALVPSVFQYNSLILAWSKSGESSAGERCDEILEQLWKYYDETGEERFIPTKSTYLSSMTAWSRSRKGKAAADRVEALLEEMESQGKTHSWLKPCTVAVNIALNTWSKSRHPHATIRCEAILARMEKLSLAGRKSLAPDTISFNTVMDTLARSRTSGCEQRAEELLEHMNELASENIKCQPDEISFNVVINAWAKSSEKGAARRADAILRHMYRRWTNKESDLQPNTATYNTVLTAWAHSSEEDAPFRAEKLFDRMLKAIETDDAAAKPNTITYNILINALVKARTSGCSKRVLELLDQMKAKNLPDVVSYTSCIDALAKDASMEASVKAERLLEELEDRFEEQKTERLRPNIRTYTSVVHAIARSRVKPERAETILRQVEAMFEDGDTAVQPDTVCYDAVINAFGWARDYKGKAKKCIEIYQRMMELYDTGANTDAKPDIITLNSVLNACAYDNTASPAERGEIVESAIEILEHYQSRMPEHGYPNHITYGNVLCIITNLMKQSPQRDQIAETLFWQCCKSGNVSVLVVNQLYRAVSYSSLSKLLGDALLSKKSETRIRFDASMFPESWKRYAPRKSKKKVYSRPSPKASAYVRTQTARVTGTNRQR